MAEVWPNDFKPLTAAMQVCVLDKINSGVTMHHVL